MTKKFDDLGQMFGKEYKRIVQCTKRYLALKGSRASKKSKNIALRWVYLLYCFPLANLLVVRKHATLLKQSCRADLVWALNKFGVQQEWDIPKAELTLTNKRTGQVILFRGATDTDGIASITVEKGVLNFCWIEEAFQLQNESDFDMIDESIRGEVPEGYFKQLVLTFNPWSEKSWLRKRFFILHEGETLDDDVPYIPGKQKSTASTFACTRNYTCNEWLDASDLAKFEDMRINDPQRYKVAGEGDWGVTGETIYNNWEVKEFSWRELFYAKDSEGRPVYENRIGLDFGYSNNTAGVRLLVDRANREIYVCEELYEQRLSTDEIYKRLTELDWAREVIHADSEAPQTIKDLNKMGCSRIFGVKKEQGSVRSGIRMLRGYKIFISPECENFEIEISHYANKQMPDGSYTDEPVKEWDHLMDAMRYAMKDDSAGVEFVNTDASRRSPLPEDETETAREDDVEKYRRRLSRIYRK
jgi:phage terminase large subunit